MQSTPSVTASLDKMEPKLKGKQSVLFALVHFLMQTVFSKEIDQAGLLLGSGLDV